MFNLETLIHEVKHFNQTQTLILQELKEIRQLLQKNAINHPNQQG